MEGRGGGGGRTVYVSAGDVYVDGCSAVDTTVRSSGRRWERVGITSRRNDA